MSNVPHPFEFLLLSLAAWRVYRLLAEDTILDRPRKWVIGEASEKAPQRYRKEVDIFFACPFCLGFWVVVVGWLAWLVWPHAVDLIAVPFAASAVVGLIAKNMDD